jgi:hypothetical protein
MIQQSWLFCAIEGVIVGIIISAYMRKWLNGGDWWFGDDPGGDEPDNPTPPEDHGLSTKVREQINDILDRELSIKV